MSSSNWRDSEIRELLTIMGKKVTQSHLTKTLKDGAIYEKDAEEHSLRAKPRPNRLANVKRPKEGSRTGPTYAPKLFTMLQNIKEHQAIKISICTDNITIY